MPQANKAEHQEKGTKSKKQIKLETQLTAGCGYGRAKKRLLQSFWTVLWPRLEADCGWYKEAGTGEETGATYFIPPATTKEGKDRYDKVKPVIDYVSSIRDECPEAEAAKAYLKEVRFLEKNANEAEAAVKQRTDYSWKTDRQVYSKKCSRVGDEFQVTVIPSSNQFEMEKKNLVNGGTDKEKNEYELVWDPNRAKESQKVNLVHLVVPHNKKEFAIMLLHIQNYSPTNLFQSLRCIAPIDGSDWSNDEKERFHMLIFETRKNINKVTKRMGKSLNSCLAYYFGTYKQSDDYRLLKIVIEQERTNQGGQRTLEDRCKVCNGTGNFIWCDSCDELFHFECVSPPIKNSLPEGNWYCSDCVTAKVKDVKDCLFRKKRMVKNSFRDYLQSKKQKLDEKISISSLTCHEVLGTPVKNGGATNSGSLSSTHRKNGVQKFGQEKLNNATNQFVLSIQKAFS